MMPKATKMNADASAAQATGLSWLNIVMLVISFAETYGPNVLTIIADVAAAVKSGNVADLAALVAKDGPEIVQMAQAIASIFGVPLPPIPVAAGS
jgi:hypothetical protein